jgi:hypothetical protein
MTAAVTEGGQDVGGGTWARKCARHSTGVLGETRSFWSVEAVWSDEHKRPSSAPRPTQLLGTVRQHDRVQRGPPGWLPDPAWSVVLVGRRPDRSTAFGSA